jgi:hypothetical protein
MFMFFRMNRRAGRETLEYQERITKRRRNRRAPDTSVS